MILSTLYIHLSYDFVKMSHTKLMNGCDDTLIMKMDL